MQEALQNKTVTLVISGGKLSVNADLKLQEITGKKSA